MSYPAEKVSFETPYRIESVHWWLRARRRILLDFISRLTPARDGALVVDIGCGAGTTLFAVSRMGYRTLGIDNNPMGVEKARSLGLSDVRLGEAPDAFDPLPPGPYLFLLADVIEHIEDDYGQFGAMVARMPSGSKVVVTVPALMCLWSEHDVMYGHYRRYTRESLERLLKDTGLEVRFISYFCSLLFPLVFMVRKARKLVTSKLPPDLEEVNPVLNKALETVFSVERYLLRFTTLPVGSSLLAVAEKK